MIDSTIGKMAKKAARARLLGALLALAVAIGAGAIFNKHIINVLNGPYTVTAESLDGLQSPNDTDQIYITLENVTTFDTEAYEYETENGIERITAYLGGIYTGDTLLLVKTKSPINIEEIRTWTGEIVMIPTHLDRDIVQEWFVEDPTLVGYILPVMLDTTYDFTFGAYAVIAAIALAVLVGLWWLSRWLIFSTNEDRNPLIRRLRFFGDPSNVAQQIDMELSSANGQKKLKSATFTRNWLLQSNSSTFKATRHQDVVWVYQKVVRSRYGKNYFAAIHDRHGQTLLIQAPEKDVLSMLQMEAQLAPWALMGHDKRIEQMWNKQRDQLVTAVEQRKAQVKAQQ